MGSLCKALGTLWDRTDIARRRAERSVDKRLRGVLALACWETVWRIPTTSCGYAGALRIAYCVSEGRRCVLLRMAYGVWRIRIEYCVPVGGSACGVWRMRLAYCRPVGGSAHGVWRMAYLLIAVP